MAAAGSRLLSGISRTTAATATVARKLLDDSKEFGIYTRKVKLLIESIAKGIIETLTKGGDLGDVWPVVAMSFIEVALELGDVSGEGIGVLLKVEKAIFGFLDLI